MSGHQHIGGPGSTQNQGNIIGDRPCVRQSRLYREQCGGNAMKELMGQDQLKWDTNRTQGAYEGGRVYDHNDGPQAAAHGQPSQVSQPVQARAQVQQAPQAQEQAPTGHRKGAGVANRTTYNIFTGQ